MEKVLPFSFPGLFILFFCLLTIYFFLSFLSFLFLLFNLNLLLLCLPCPLPPIWFLFYFPLLLIFYSLFCLFFIVYFMLDSSYFRFLFFYYLLTSIICSTLSFYSPLLFSLFCYHLSLFHFLKPSNLSLAVVFTSPPLFLPAFFPFSNYHSFFSLFILSLWSLDILSFLIRLLYNYSFLPLLSQLFYTFIFWVSVWLPLSSILKFAILFRFCTNFLLVSSNFSRYRIFPLLIFCKVAFPFLKLIPFIPLSFSRQIHLLGFILQTFP
jgi:hypothetical protein